MAIVKKTQPRMVRIPRSVCQFKTSPYTGFPVVTSQVKLVIRYKTLIATIPIRCRLQKGTVLTVEKSMSRINSGAEWSVIRFSMATGWPL